MTVGSQVKQTIASLKSAHSLLHTYSLQSQNAQAKAVFHQAMIDTEDVIHNLSKRLQTIEFEESQFKGL